MRATAAGGRPFVRAVGGARRARVAMQQRTAFGIVSTSLRAPSRAARICVAALVCLGTAAAAPQFAAAQSDGAATAFSAERDLLAQGGVALEENRPGDALTYYEAVLADAPNNRQAVLGRAKALDALGRIPEAMAVYDAMLRRNPADGPALYYRGLALYHIGDLEAAERDFDAAISAGMTASVVHQRLGDARYARADLLGALAAYEAAAQADDPHPSVYRSIGNVAYALRDYAAADRAYTIALELNPEDGYAAYYRAWTRERLGLTLDALQDYSLAFDLIGDVEPRVAIDRGSLLLENGVAAAAMADFQSALNLDPMNPTALLGAGMALIAQGQSVEAEMVLTRLLVIAGDDRALRVSALFQRGRARLMNADFIGAREDLDLAISLDPTHADARFNRAIARARLDDPAGALDDLMDAAELKPYDAEIHYALARAAIVADLPEIAMEAAARAEALAPDSPTGAHARATTLLALDRPEEALQELDVLLLASPRDVEALRLSGVALIRLRRYDDALDVAQRLTARAPRNPAGPLLEAEAYIGLGRTEPARAALNRANELGAPAAVLTRLAGERWMAVAELGGGDPALAGQGDALAQAEIALDQSIELSGDVDSLIDRAAVRIQRGDLAAARQDLDRAVVARPQDARLRFARADVLRQMGDCEGAIRDYDAGLSLEPSNSDAHAARASCKLSEGRYLGAASDMIVSWF